MMSLGDKVRGRKVKLHDMCLRDGMHSMRHQITLEQMINIASGLDDAGVPLIQVTHGDGLGGSSLSYGRGLHSDREYITAVAKMLRMRQSRSFMFPALAHLMSCAWLPTAGRPAFTLPPIAPKRM